MTCTLLNATLIGNSEKHGANILLLEKGCVSDASASSRESGNRFCDDPAYGHRICGGQRAAKLGDTDSQRFVVLREFNSAVAMKH
jgi:hypothetical protein